MRILHVAASYLPAVRYGGTIVSVHGLCKALASHGHDVHVFTTNVDGPMDSAVPLGVPTSLDGVRVWYFPSRHGRRLYWSPPMRRALTDHLRSFDVVHVHGIYLWPFWAAARTATRAGVPYVISLRGMLEKDLIARKSRWLKSAWIRMIETRNIEQAAAIHVTSRREAEEAAAFGFRLPPLHEIPNGVELDVEPAGPLSPALVAALGDRPYLLFIGRINWKKGLDRLIRALRSAPAVRIAIVGNDEEGYSGQLVQQAIEAGVQDRIMLLGAVHGADKAALLSRAHGLVLPSYSENFGNVVIEAMAAGRPVIVTPEVGAAPIVTRSGAGIVADGDPAAFGAAMTSLMQDDDLRRTMGERGRHAAAAFTWNAIATEMETMYQAIARLRLAPA